jgi:WD40 repeat protein
VRRDSRAVPSAAKWFALLGNGFFVNSAAFSPNGVRVVTASSDGTARIWDAATGNEIAVFRGHEGFVLSAAFSPDGLHVVTASTDKTARIWDVASAKEITILRGHGERVNSAAFNPDGTLVVTASNDGTARVWDTTIAKEIAVLRGPERLAVFSPDGLHIVTASDDQIAHIWGVMTAKDIADDPLNSASFHADASRFVTGPNGQTAGFLNNGRHTMPVKDFLIGACSRLGGASKLTRDEMRLAGYPDGMALIDVCP